MRGRFAIIIAIWLVACGQVQTPTALPTTRTIDVEMRDFAFSPETLTLLGGERVTLRFKNVGKLEHEFMAGTDPAYGKGYLNDWLAHVQLEGSAGHMEHAGAGVRVDPGTTIAITFVVPDEGGVFEFGCFVIGHYEFGMHGRVVVDAKPASTGAPGQGRPGQSAPATHAPMGDDDGEGH